MAERKSLSPDDLERFAPVVDLPIDPGIRRAVLLLRSAGVETLESCEGGEGHACPEPVVMFAGSRADGERAVQIARAAGLPVIYLREAYSVLPSGALTPPCWEMVFCSSMTALASA